MRKERIVNCKECRNDFKTKWRNIFCSQRCAAIYTNRNRQPRSDETKRKSRESMIKYWNDHPEKRKMGTGHPAFIGSFTKGKYKGKTIQSILDVSSRTASKVLKRLDIGCCICGWREASCDIHHINGKKIDNADGHWNLTCLCPNHHRMYHNKKIEKERFISLDKYFPENWKDLYYG